ncbi:mitochondrial carrier [Teratosphaeria nubilosa]|uniref:Mitochondrial carrier n=1 Tax=Teratosphaeria nubilosa TaxID=161662 RepID=A0A6G1KV15_9PEZI|nr:mitochondrial carrier [Teratosphaeria nubilosa]
MGGPDAPTVYNGQLDAFELYHLVQESPEYSSTTSITGGPVLPALGHALAGSLATASAKVLLYPLELVTTRLQVHRQLRGRGEAEGAARDADAEYKNVIDAAQKIYKAEGGLKALYTGAVPDVGKGIADSFLFFLAYTVLRQRQLRRDDAKQLSVVKELGVGIAAGTFAKLITTPIQNIVTRQQTAALVAARRPTTSTTPGQSDQLSIKDIALQIRSERGLTGFWAGYSASIILTLNPAITFAVDNLLKQMVPKSRRENPSPALTFLVAALSKAIATTITYPVMLAKSRAQTAIPTTLSEAEGTEKSNADPAHLADKSNNAPTTTRQQLKHRAHQALRLLSAQYAIFLTLQKIHRNEGFSGLYAGIEGEVLKGFLSHGLTMMVKEKVHVGVIHTYYASLKLTKRWPEDLEKVQDGAQAIASDARERAENVGVTVKEGVERLAGDGKKAVTVD